MHAGKGKLYQDQLYGAKVLSPLAISVIDSAEFQRLSGLRQLGFSDVMYRGARHSRFEHSVGTYFICRTIMRRIVQNHERLGLEHPGKFVSPVFRFVSENAEVAPDLTTNQSRWRGLTEVVSVAALLHDIGHVPFGHTLEDEFTGLYERHDSLAGPRFFEMLFNESSDLSKVFTELTPQWFEKISNETLRQLIYVILSWKEKITPPRNFPALLEEALKSPRDDQHRDRLQKLQHSHSKFVDEQMFHPFMSDIIGNTICADLLDYLPRDRMNLGMEPRRHTRLQRYFTIRQGTLYKDEGLRMSIMVTRRGRGGQKRDVATGVLDIMRERYEMAERVFYHHKKAAASAMLAKLVEIAGERKPRDDGRLYPAPWEASPGELPEVPHMAHLSDSGIIDYLGSVEVAPEYKSLQHRLFAAIRFRRNDMYRTLLVIDHDVVNASSHTIDFFIDELRGSKGRPSNSGRRKLEAILEDASKAKDSDDIQPGEVIIYCPSAAMQAKEVDARLEIIENSVLPLRRQRTQFVYNGDIKVLQEYYEDLWRAYILVSPELFKDATRCQALIDVFCDHFAVSNKELVYRKVRTHNFTVPHEESSQKALGCFQDFVAALPFESVPVPVTNRLLGLARHDGVFLKRTHANDDTRERLSKLLDVTILQLAVEDKDSARKLNGKQKKTVHAYSEELLADSKSSRISTQAGEWADFETYAEYVLASVIAPLEVAGKKNQP